jgi:putative ABC transport system substrate-binding protein
MRRREFISLVGAAAMLCSTRSGAQQRSKTYLIGVLTPQLPSLIKALKDGLRKLGYIEGQNLKSEYMILQAGGPSAETLAAELVKLSPDVIVTMGTVMSIAAKQATTTIPIVIAPVQDAVGAGIVTNLRHPGGNITGTTLYGSEVAAKRMDVFKQAMPEITRIAVLGTRSRLTELLWPETQTAAKKLGLEARLFTVQTLEELSATFDAIVQDNANGLLVLPDGLFFSARQMTIVLAAQHRLPAIYENKEFVQDGGLISYGPNIAEMTRRAAVFVDKILKGAKPGDLPIEGPTEYELVINLKTAKDLGLAIPDKLLTVADEMVE